MAIPSLRYALINCQNNQLYHVTDKSDYGRRWDFRPLEFHAKSYVTKAVNAHSVPASDAGKPPTLGFFGLETLQMLMHYVKVIISDLEPGSPSPDLGFVEHTSCSVIVQGLHDAAPSPGDLLNSEKPRQKLQFETPRVHLPHFSKALLRRFIYLLLKYSFYSAKQLLQ